MGAVLWFCFLLPLVFAIVKHEQNNLNAGAPTVDLTGWTLVRRVKAGLTWHPAKDHCLGTDVYGEPSTDPTASVTFSLKFDTLTYDQMLFATGDGTKWVIVSRAQVETMPPASPFLANIISSFINPQNYTCQWYNRPGNPEDPWISVRDHFSFGCSAGASTEDHSMLYGENSFPGWNYWIKNHNGANVFVKQVGPIDPNKACVGIYSATTQYPDATCYLPYATLNAKGAWCPLTTAVGNTSYLQIDLGSVQTITAVTTQGRQNYPQWTTSYKLQYSVDGVNHIDLGTFQGNKDQNTMVTNSLTPSVSGRYVRITPLTFYGWPSLRACVTTANPISQPDLPLFYQGGCTCQGRYSATHEYPDPGHCDAEGAFVNKSNQAWCSVSPNAQSQNDFLQIDLGSPQNLVGIFTQGRSDVAQWVTSFFVSTSLDGNGDDVVQNGGLYPGNTDQNTIVANRLDGFARYIRIYPQGYYGWSSMRVCVQTAQVVPPPVLAPNYTAGNTTCQGRVSATTEHPSCVTKTLPINSRQGWCALSPGQDDEFVQIDFGSPQGLIAIYIQARADAGQYVTSFYLYTSNDGYTLTPLGGLYGGNSGLNTIVGHSLLGPDGGEVVARYVRIYPVGFYGHTSMRLCLQTETPVAPVVYPTYAKGPTVCQGEYSATTEHPTCSVEPAQINVNNGWCALTAGVLTDFVQIDLGSVQNVINFFIQGRSAYNQWVTSFYLYGSEDGHTLTQLGGLYDGVNDINGFAFDSGTRARYIRIVPHGFSGHTSLRACVQTDVTAPAIVHPKFAAGPKVCQGIISTTTEHPTCEPSLGIINQPQGDAAWCALTAGKDSDYLQIDLGSKQDLANFYIQGRPAYSQWITSFYLYASDDGTNLNQIGGLFGGNNDMTTIMGYNIAGASGRFIRVVPEGFSGHTSLRTCVETVNPIPAISLPAFAAGPDTCQGEYTATSAYSNDAACSVFTSQINTPGAYCAQVPGTAGEFVQIDLGTVLDLSAIYFQSRGSSVGQWVTSFYVKISSDGHTLQDVDGLLDGNHAINVIRSHSLVGYSARYIRMYPQGFNGHTSFRSCVKTTTPVPALAPQVPAPSKDDASYCPGVYSTVSQYPAADCNATKATIGVTGGYCPAKAAFGSDIYLQIDLDSLQTIDTIFTQGRSNYAQWVYSYFVQASDTPNGIYQSVGGLFKGNTDQNTLRSNSLGGVVARSVRIFPQAFYGHPSFRACLYLHKN